MTETLSLAQVAAAAAKKRAELAATPEGQRQAAERMDAQEKTRAGLVKEALDRAERTASGRSDGAEAEKRAAADTDKRKAAQEWAEKNGVDINTLINAYEDNEIAADQRYQGRSIHVRGWVTDVKKDILGSPYVIVAATKTRDSLRAVQCSVAKPSLAKAATLSVGDYVEVRGDVAGLMLNVLLRNCDIVGPGR